MAPHRSWLFSLGKPCAALAVLALAATAQQACAAPPADPVVAVAFDPAALHARDLDILEGTVRAALPPSTIQFAEGRTTIVERISAPQEDVRFVEAVRKLLAGQRAFVMQDQLVTVYRLAPVAKAGAEPGAGVPNLVTALGLLRPPLPGVTVEDGIDAAVVRADNARTASVVAVALNQMNAPGLAVTPLTPTSWRVGYDAPTERMLRHEPSKGADLFKMFDLYTPPGRALLSRLMIGEMVRGELRDPLDFDVEPTTDGAQAWVADPNGGYGERLKQALAGDPSLTVSSAPGEILTIALSSPPAVEPESSSQPLPEVDQLMSQIQTLADRTLQVVRGGGGVVVQSDVAALRERVRTALVDAGLRVETQPDQSLKVTAGEARNPQPDPAMLVATVEARARALGLSAVAAASAGAGRVDARFETQAAADAFRRSIRANSTSFAIRVVDDSGRDDDKTPPSPGDDSLPQREGGRLWLKPGSPITGGMMLRARVVEDEQDHSSAIAFQLSSEGRAAFAGLTSANVGARLAIVLDGVIVEAPQIMGPLTGGQGEISCGCSPDEAQKLAAAMMAHAADLPLKLVDAPGK